MISFMDLRWFLLFPVLLSAGTGAILASLAWSRRKAPGALPFAWMMVALSIWATFTFVSHISADLRVVELLSRLSFSGSSLIPSAWIWMGLEVNRQKVLREWRLLLLLSLEPVLAICAAWINPGPFLFWKEMYFIESGGINHFQTSLGPAARFHELYSQVLLIAGTLLFLQAVMKPRVNNRIQARSLIAGILGIWVSNVFGLFDTSAWMLQDLAPIVFSLGSLLMAWGMLRYQLLEVIPIAYDAIIESIREGVIVIDDTNRIVAANPSALRGLDRSPENTLGKPAHEVLAPWPEMVDKFTHTYDAWFEFSTGAGEGQRYLDGRISPVYNRSHHLTGRVLVAHDITGHKLVEKALERRAKEMDALNATLLDIATPHELPALLQAIVERAVRLLETQGGSLMLRDVNEEGVHAVVRYTSDPFQECTDLEFVNQAANFVVRSGQPLILDGDHPWPREAFSGPPPEPACALLSAPMIWRNEVTGVINVQHGYARRRFTQTNLELLVNFAHQAAIAVENARLLQSERRQRERAEILSEVIGVLNASHNQNEVLAIILDGLARVVPYDSASIMLLRGDSLFFVADRNFASSQQRELPLELSGLPHIKEVLEKRTPIMISDTHKDPRWRLLESSAYIRCWLGVPLISAGETIGLLNLDKRQPGYYIQQDAELAAAFANQAATAILNARLFASAEQRAQEAETLRQASAAVSSQLNLEETLESILIQLKRVVPYDSASVQLLRPGCLEIVGGRGWDNPEKVRGLQFPVPGDNANSIVIATRQPYILGNAPEAYPAFRSDPHNHIRSWLGVPLIVHEDVIGMLAVDSKTPYFYQENQVRLATAFADQVAIAIDNANLYQAARQSSEQWAILYQASQEIVAASLDPENIYAAIHRAASRLMPTESFLITLLNEQLPIIDAVYVVEKDGRKPNAQIPKNRGVSGRVIATGQSLIIADVGHPEVEPVRIGEGEFVQSLIAVPLHIGNRVIGTLSAQSYQINAYTPTHQHLLEMLGSYASIALENSRLFSEVQRLAITDPLTEIYNRRQLFELGQREFRRARRFDRPLAVIMLDIDHFKQVNDQHGHPAGDQVLLALAKRFQENLREIDILGRYGGEEFVMILPETSQAAAFQVADRLRLMVAENPIPVGKFEITVTISAGVVSIAPTTRDLADLIAHADVALYDAKAAGRNAVAEG